MRTSPLAAAILAALAMGRCKSAGARRGRKPKSPPPPKCPVHGEPAIQNRYGKARYYCGCLWKHARLAAENDAKGEPHD